MRAEPGSLPPTRRPVPSIAAARSSPDGALSAEQSNSSLRFGDVLIVKLFRRLQPGLNPDEEILRALADVEVRASAALRRLCVLALARWSDRTRSRWRRSLSRTPVTAGRGCCSGWLGSPPGTSTRGPTGLPRSGCWAGEPASCMSRSVRSRNPGLRPRRPTRGHRRRYSTHPRRDRRDDPAAAGAAGPSALRHREQAA